MNFKKRKRVTNDVDVYDFDGSESTTCSEYPDNVNIEIIEDLCSILKRVDSPALEWLNKCEESLKDIDYFTELEFSDEKKISSVNYPLLPQVFHLLRECLLAHQWPEALKVLQDLPSISVGASRSIWKVGTELLAMNGESNSDLMQELFNKMKIVKELNCKEVVLDYVVYLLSINNSTDAIEVMQKKIVKPEKHSDYLNNLHKAYMGLLWYLEWKKASELLEKEKTRHEESLMTSQHPSTSRVLSYTVQKTNFYKKAIACFEEIQGVTGIWDIFVQRHVELLMHEELTEKCLEVLTKYVETNPENLNAHMYLYNFCLENYPEKDLLQQLQTIAKLSPSDELVLDLCSRLMKDDICSALKHLFILLDYSCWQDKVKPWKMMADCLHAYKGNGKMKHDEDFKSVQQDIKYRDSWWPSYHFSDYRVTIDSNISDLNLHKACVAGVLYGTGCDYVKNVKDHLSKSETKLLKKYLSKVGT